MQPLESLPCAVALSPAHSESACRAHSFSLAEHSHYDVCAIERRTHACTEDSEDLLLPVALDAFDWINFAQRTPPDAWTRAPSDWAEETEPSEHGVSGGVDSYLSVMA